MPGPDDRDAGVAESRSVSVDEEDGGGVIDGGEARRVEGVPEMENGAPRSGERRELADDLPLLPGERRRSKKPVDVAREPGGESGTDRDAPFRRSSHREGIAKDDARRETPDADPGGSGRGGGAPGHGPRPQPSSSLNLVRSPPAAPGVRASAITRTMGSGVRPSQVHPTVVEIEFNAVVPCSCGRSGRREPARRAARRCPSLERIDVFLMTYAGSDARKAGGSCFPTRPGRRGPARSRRARRACGGSRGRSRPRSPRRRSARRRLSSCRPH